MKNLILVGLLMSIGCGRHFRDNYVDQNEYREPKRCRNAPNPRRCWRRNKLFNYQVINGVNDGK